MEKKDKVLTIDEAYDALIDFLERYDDEISQSDEVGSLLNRMYLLQDGNSADPEALKDWHDSVNEILNQNPRVRPYFMLPPR